MEDTTPTRGLAFPWQFVKEEGATAADTMAEIIRKRSILPAFAAGGGLIYVPSQWRAGLGG